MRKITFDGIEYTYRKYHYNRTRYELSDNSGYIGALVLDYPAQEYWAVLGADNVELERLHYNQFGSDWDAILWALAVIAQ